MALTLTKQPGSDTGSTITLEWTPPANVGGYVLYANGQVVSVATANLKDGTPRKDAKFSKTAPGPPFQVAAVVRLSSGAIIVEYDSYPDEAPLPPNVSRSAPTAVVTT